MGRVIEKLNAILQNELTMGLDVASLKYYSNSAIFSRIIENYNEDLPSCLKIKNCPKGRKMILARIKRMHSKLTQPTVDTSNCCQILEKLESTQFAQDVKKEENILFSNHGEGNIVVTIRRKRSLSVDDSLMSSSMLVSRLPRPVSTQNTPKKSQTTTSKPLSRTIIPNFAAINNKNFQKMENIFDHVERKQERSKILINSNTKIRPPLKKIDLGFSSTKNTTTTELTESQENISKIKKLPNPQRGIRKGVIQQRIPNQKAPRDHQQQQIPTQATKNTINRNIAASSSSSNDDKMAGRLQRHMDLFKGRAPTTRFAVDSRKNDTVIRGVRSNLRFELQMENRKKN